MRAVVNEICRLPPFAVSWPGPAPIYSIGAFFSRASGFRRAFLLVSVEPWIGLGATAACKAQRLFCFWGTQVAVAAMDDGSRRWAGRLLVREIPAQVRGIMALRWAHGLCLDRARASAPATTRWFRSACGRTHRRRECLPASPAYEPLDDGLTRTAARAGACVRSWWAVDWNPSLDGAP